MTEPKWPNPLVLDLRKFELLGGGCECECYALSQRRVIKVYLTNRERDQALERQKVAYRVGIGPRTFGVLDGELHAIPRYGYVSSRALVTRTLYPTDDLRKTAERIGFKTFDICGPNIGMWKDRMVLVDFGGTSLT